ncbi:fimbrial protein [Dysgonomonas sp. Marseille-P4677]|uniref:fimbrial protein n=1 Tax=Dysgonomonas sp. Marseille-P4677 TaxID=2364790 RepID=UPI0019148117|nr:fimbrial protein [Dysgonomonas sp. Marseille-P4677]
MNIKKHINLLIYILVGMLMYSCSGEESIPVVDNTGQQATTLSILFNAPQEGGLKSSGNPEIDAESKIYSLEVIVFKSQGEAEEGKLDGYGCVTRKTRDVIGQTYDKEYIEIDEIQGVKLTAGKRDVYVVANAPDSCFGSVKNLQEFLSKYESLSTQGRYPHPGNVTPDPNEELPIGGINPSNLKTNLTMCNYIKDVAFNNLYEQHYLGYTTNSGRPTGVAPSHGNPLFGTDPFLLERLVARVAIEKIEFAFPADGLLFEPGYNKSTNYTYQIDSVFMMNVRTNSKFAAGSQPEFAEKFGHGCNIGYSFLNQPGRLSDLHQESQLTDFLVEAITTPNYDISKNATPLWFYAFENEDNAHPTYLVIGVKYNFKSTKDNSLKTVKSYYQVVVNPPASGKLANHDYIKRNYQYQITAIIKGLGGMYGNNPTPLKSSNVANSDIEITETVGRNLFPWTGDTYR